jgi:hypothetical protein
MGKLEQVSKQILAYLLNDFQERELNAESLHRDYVGVFFDDLKRKCFEIDNTTTTVDFDLALKDLEDEELVSTGPRVPYENSPNSMLVMTGLRSKREYLYLTAKGYKAAR